MARLNITIPDALYTRLERLRDRINLSKVCANALEKEVIMLEGKPNISDPRIAQLLQRLQSTRERWYRRGHDDGTQWAVETATREELCDVAMRLAKLDGRQLVEFYRFPESFDVHMTMPHPHAKAAFHAVPAFPPHVNPKDMPPFPPHLKGMPFPPPPHGEMHTFYAPEAGAKAMSVPAHAEMHHTFFSPGPPSAFPASFPLKERFQYWENSERESRGESEEEGLSARVEIDEAAYLEGWRDAVRDIWQAIAPALM